MNWKELFRKSTYALTSISLGTGFHAYFITLETRKIAEEIKVLEERNRELETIIECSKIDRMGSDLKSAKITDLEYKMQEYHDRMESLKRMLDSAKESTDWNFPSSSTEYLVKSVEETSSKLLETSQEIIRILNEKNKFLNNQNMFDLFKDLINFFNNLYANMNLEQISALMHLSSSILILVLLSSVMGIIYGDFLIKYFRLEEKYPRLARVIVLRRKFQQYYLFLNFLSIIIVLLALIGINFYALTIL